MSSSREEVQAQRTDPPAWLREAVVYQVYVRSFQDSDGDGVGDLPGVTARLDHIAALGAAAVWLTPIFPSPNADFGYDVSDYLTVAPEFGTVDDLDALVRRAHGLGLRVILDFVPCHTSNRHRWFRERPDFYVWADEPPNNWRATFGGSAWALDPHTGRYYLHSFFPEQADLDWRNPEVRDAMGAALRLWSERGIDGFRLDALDRIMKDERLRDDPLAAEVPALPAHPEYSALDHVHSGNAPDVGVALQAIRQAVGNRALIGEVYLPSSQLGPYLDALDVVFAFEAMQHAGDPAALRTAVVTGLLMGKQGWVVSNHDFSRLGSRVGAVNLRAATLLMLALPGPVFLFQGDELGLLDASTEAVVHDRADRDRFRAPMPWDASAHGGFSAGEPWLPVGDGVTPDVEAQRADPGSHLSLVERLIALRPSLAPSAQVLASAPGTIVLERGAHQIAVNLTDAPCPVPGAGELVIEARSGDGADAGQLPPHGGWIRRSPR